MAKELNFTLEGVQGDLKLKYGPFNQRLYQDGREIKKQGRFVHVAVFRGQKIDLEERLSIREYIVGGLPVLLVFLGGLIGALFGIMGATFNYNHMRQEKSFMKQLLLSLGVSILCYVAYFIFAIGVQLIVAR